MKPILPFGKYLLLERISVGGMAEVFKARATDDDASRLLAIKRILPSMAEDADFITMFIDEARISGQLNHDNIARIYELSQVGDSHFIAMEFVWGKDVLQLQNRFRRLKATMPFPMAAFIAAKMCEALDYAHRKKGADGSPLGIIHRDVSPQNVLISYQGQVKLIDFGIAKAASRSTKTQAGVLKGKFGYMSPEQVSGQPLDRRSDVFAIGTILYEMMTADRLFVAESDFATLEKVRNVDVKMPSEAVPGCPAEIDRIVRKALARSPEERYQWASDMATELNWWLATLPEAFGEVELAAWMQQHFAVEMKRETQALDEQQRAAADYRSGLLQAAVPVALAAGGSGGVALSLVPSAPEPPARTDEMRSDDLAALMAEGAAAAPGSELAGESTMILEPGAPTPAALAEASDEPRRATVQGLGVATPLAAASGELSNESTQILQPGLHGPLLAAATVADMPSQATAILDTSQLGLPSLPPSLPGGAPSQALPAVGSGPQRPALAIAPTPPPLRPRGQLDGNPGTSRVDLLAYGKPRKSTVGRDILTGVGVALLIVAGVAGYHLYQRSRATLGTLVVAVSPPSGARLLLDGVERGAVEAGMAFTIKDVPAGSHRVEVLSATGRFSDAVSVQASDVSVVTAVLQPLTPPTTPVATPAPVPSGAAPAPAAAAPGPAAPPTPPATTPAAPAPAAAAVPGAAAAVEPGATVPTEGHLVVRTDPPGADVNVNGRNIGVTPVEARHIERARQVRVSIRKAGYVTVARYLDFEGGPERTLDLKLQSLGEGTSLAPPPAPSAPAPAPSSRPASRSSRAGRGKPVAPAPGAAAPAPATAAPGPAPAAAVSPPAAEKPADHAPVASAEPGYLVANTQPWARVAIDGKDTGKTTPIAPLSKLPLKPGRHSVTFTVDGKKYTYPIEVKAGEITRLIKTLGEGE